MLVESFSGVRGLVKEDLTKEVIEGYCLAFSNLLKDFFEFIRPNLRYF